MPHFTPQTVYLRTRFEILEGRPLIWLPLAADSNKPSGWRDSPPEMGELFETGCEVFSGNEEYAASADYRANINNFSDLY